MIYVFFSVSNSEVALYAQSWLLSIRLLEQISYEPIHRQVCTRGEERRAPRPDAARDLCSGGCQKLETQIFNWLFIR